MSADADAPAESGPGVADSSADPIIDWLGHWLDGPPDPLTPRQREAVETALELGYYEVPANVKMADIAEEMGTNRQNVGELLRRAHGNAIEAVVEGPETPAD